MRNLLGSLLTRNIGTAVTAVVVFLLIAGAGVAWFGSPRNLLAFLRGDVLAVEPPVYDIGTQEWGTPVEGKVKVTNLTSRPIRIQGAAGDCPCVSAPSLPLVVPPFGSAEMDVMVRAVGGADEGNGRMEHSLELFLDTPGPEVDVHFQGTLYGVENHLCKPP